LHTGKKFFESSRCRSLSWSLPASLAPRRGPPVGAGGLAHPQWRWSRARSPPIWALATACTQRHPSSFQSLNQPLIQAPHTCTEPTTGHLDRCRGFCGDHARSQGYGSQQGKRRQTGLFRRVGSPGEAVMLCLRSASFASRSRGPWARPSQGPSASSTSVVAVISGAGGLFGRSVVRPSFARRSAPVRSHHRGVRGCHSLVWILATAS